MLAAMRSRLGALAAALVLVAGAAACDGVLGIHPLDGDDPAVDSGAPDAAGADLDAGGRDAADGGRDATLDGSDDGATADASIDVRDEGLFDVDDAAPDPDVNDASPPSPTPLSGIAISERAICALEGDGGGVFCWGSDDMGQLGNGFEGPAYVVLHPQPVIGLSTPVHLVAGLEHVCALLESGSLYCWGGNGEGQTGSGHSGDDTSPTSVSLAGGVKLVAAQSRGTCVVAKDGHTISCWGLFVPGSSTGSSTPETFSVSDAGVLALAGGSFATCGLFDDGLVRCWGSNAYDALGDGDRDAAAFTKETRIVPFAPDAGVERLVGGGDFTCALTHARRAMCWGENGAYELGPNVPMGDQPVPVDIGLDDVVDLGIGGIHACALFGDGGVSCWGDAESGQLGTGIVNGAVSSPTPVPGLGPASALVVGDENACAQTDAGVYCWGNNQYGQLGFGASDAGPAPVGAFRLEN